MPSRINPMQFSPMTDYLYNKEKSPVQDDSFTTILTNGQTLHHLPVPDATFEQDFEQQVAPVRAAGLPWYNIGEANLKVLLPPHDKQKYEDFQIWMNYFQPKQLETICGCPRDHPVYVMENPEKKGYVFLCENQNYGSMPCYRRGRWMVYCSGGDSKIRGFVKPCSDRPRLMQELRETLQQQQQVLLQMRREVDEQNQWLQQQRLWYLHYLKQQQEKRDQLLREKTNYENYKKREALKMQYGDHLLHQQALDRERRHRDKMSKIKSSRERKYYEDRLHDERESSRKDQETHRNMLRQQRVQYETELLSQEKETKKQMAAYLQHIAGLQSSIQESPIPQSEGEALNLQYLWQMENNYQTLVQRVQALQRQQTSVQPQNWPNVLYTGSGHTCYGRRFPGWMSAVWPGTVIACTNPSWNYTNRHNGPVQWSPCASQESAQEFYGKRIDELSKLLYELEELGAETLDDLSQFQNEYNKMWNKMSDILD